MNDASAAILTRIADPAARAAVVLLLAAGATATLMRRSSASARHVVWVLAIAAAVIMPAASAVVPAWRVPILPVTPQANTPVVGLAIPVSPTLRPTDAALAGGDEFAVPAPPVTLLPLVGPAVRSTPAPAVPPTVGGPTESPAAGALSHWPTTAVAIWAAGVAAVTVSWTVGVLAARRLVASAAVVRAGRLLDAADEVCRDLRIGRPVALRVGGRATVPLTAGAFRPVLLLPADAADWSPAPLRAVLLHELAHVRRWDYATLCMARLCCAMYWFDPLAWLAAARLRAERERACDDAVVRHGADPAGYAELLLAVAAGARGMSAGMVPMARQSGLVDRVKRLLEPRTDRRPVRRRAAFLAGVLTIVVLLPLAAVRPTNVSVAAAPTTTPVPVTARGGTPRLRFLAWQGGPKADATHPMTPLLPDGRPVAGGDAELFGVVPHTGLDVSASADGPVDVLYLWFSDAGFDLRSTAKVEVVDGDGRSLHAEPGGVSIKAMGADAARDHLGWVVFGLAIDAKHGRPGAAAVRLTYAAGPWRAGSQPIPADYNGGMSLGNRTQWSANGQDTHGHAFVAIATGGRREDQYGFTAHTRDGRDLVCAADTAAGNDDVYVERFTVDVPLADVVSFQPQTRPLRKVTFPTVSLTAGVHPVVPQPSTRPKAAAAPTAPPPPAVSHWEPTLTNVPPVVTATFPAAGATDVDPKLGEIRVTFSKPMADESWSWVQADAATYPRVTGRPHYAADGRTCVLPVRLEPRHTYQVWLNSDDYQNFTDRDGRPAIAYPLVFRTK